MKQTLPGAVGRIEPASHQLAAPPPDFAPRRVIALLRRELRDNLRDWRIVIPVFLLTAIFPFLMNITARVIFEFLTRYDAVLIGERMIPFGMLVVGFFPITFSLVIALETFVGEKERNSLEALLATPASDLELYLGKLLAALLLPLSAAYVGIALYLLSVSAADLVELPPSLLLQIVLLTTLKGLVMVSGAVIVSSHTTSVRAANLLASFIIIPAAVLVQAEALLMFWASYDSLWYIAAALVVVNVIMMRAGMRTFNREEILSRELDTLHLKRIFRQLGRLWVAPPREAGIAIRGGEPLSAWSPARLYREDLPALLHEGRLAIGITTLVTAAGFALGWWMGSLYAFPPGFFDLGEVAATISRENLADQVPGFSMLPKFSAASILRHNIRATLLSLFSALFSFGSMALLLVAMPMSVVGFMAREILAVGESPIRFLLSFILPHAMVELPATMLATAFALRMGAMVISPPPRFTSGEALLRGLADYVKVFLFLVLPLLAVAALIEVYVTPLIIRAAY